MDNVKLVLSALFSLGEGIEKLVDGDVSLSDIFSLIQTAKKIKPALDAAPEALLELKASTDAQKAELKAFVEADLDLQHDEVEKVAEAVIEIAIDLSSLLNLLGK